MHPLRESARASALRRYPALAFLGVAAVLAVALPSALTLPHAGPPTLAEFAPVSGQGQSAGGDLGRLGSGSSGEVGFGTGDTTPGQPKLDPGQPGGRFKQCVGSPPRQTEDPLSPPCVAFFEGDNGGATAKGVTRDEVRVVVYLRRTNSSPTGDASPPAGTIVDYDEPLSEDDWQWDRALKIYAKYFNLRYQAYGRHVHLWGLYTLPFTDPNVIPQRRADGAKVANDMGAFATLPLAEPHGPYVDEIARRGVISVTYDGFERSFYAKLDPFLWSYVPDHQDEAALTAGYICRKLAGRAARYSGDPVQVSETRRFGIVYTESEREKEYAQLKDAIKRALRKRCGIEIDAEASASEVFEQGQQQAPDGIARLRSEGVTTVIVVAASNTVLNFTSAASVVGWRPEWFVPGRRARQGLDQGAPAKLMPQDQWRHAFGISYDARWGDEGEMHWSRSYRETCGGCEIRDPYVASMFYAPLAMLFHGIQAAGPQLKAANFDKGMHAIPARRSQNAYTPAAYFTAGNFSYVKDAMEIWWDPSGRAPGDSSPGCYRLPRAGARFRADRWRWGDNDVFREGPCNGHAPIA